MLSRHVVQFLPKRPMKRGKLQVFYQYNIFSCSAFDVTSHLFPVCAVVSQRVIDFNSVVITPKVFDKI